MFYIPQKAIVFAKRMAYERMVGPSGLWSKDGCMAYDITDRWLATGQSGLWFKNGCEVWQNGQMVGQSGLWSKNGCEFWHNGQMVGQNGLWTKDGCEVWRTHRWLARIGLWSKNGCEVWRIQTDVRLEWDMLGCEGWQKSRWLRRMLYRLMVGQSELWAKIGWGGCGQMVDQSGLWCADGWGEWNADRQAGQIGLRSISWWYAARGEGGKYLYPEKENWPVMTRRPV